WFWRAYYNSPMPHSIFFHGGYAIHGSYEISRLGGPASHGCIRLHPSNAATLFSLVRRYGDIVTEGDFGSARRAASPDPRAYSPYQPRYQRDYAPHAYPGPSFPFYRY
ncbi:MAG: L,D-transpeptidase, partial [Rhodoplanes sp.]